MTHRDLLYWARKVIVWCGVAFATAGPVLAIDPPQVMLAMSLDHQYFFKAYSDTGDLDGDGVVERTYKDSIDYYGYFHAHRCYRYDDATKTFAVVGLTSGANRHYCSGALDDAWSGNFLNWATMTRMDIVRKVLYGGYRLTDTATSTVLERAHLPGDAHSFAKYYNGSDIADLTPYNPLRTDTTNGGNNDGIDSADEGITICNISYKSSGSSQGATTATPIVIPDPPPMMRVVKENYQLWAANERRQCTWQSEFPGTAAGSAGNNSNNSALSGIFAAQGNPPTTKQLTSPGGNRDQIVRVAVCDPTLFDTSDNLENCVAYGANLKPEGQLQRYGLHGPVEFGLLTGSYAKNISGGVLRKRVGPLTDEINVVDGTFTPKSGAQPGILRTLNAIRIWGYGYNFGTYRSDDAGGDNCNFLLTDIRPLSFPANGTGSGPGEGRCASWGNPMSEIYLEALRYFAVAGGTRAPTAAFDAVNVLDVQSSGARRDPDYIAGLIDDSWNPNPLTSTKLCTSLNVIALNSGLVSYDDDQNTASDFPIGDINALTNAVGDGEGITGNRYLVGVVKDVDFNEMCTGKVVTSLSNVLGVCPNASTLRGSYAMAGEAWWSHRNDIRPDLEGVQMIDTFAVSLASTIPTIEIPVGNGATVRVVPSHRILLGSTPVAGGGTNDGSAELAEFKVVRPHLEVRADNNAIPQPGTGIFSGKFYINWDDSEQGGDYDQDMWGTLEYRLDTTVSPAKLMVTTHAVSEATVFRHLFGFVITGTTQDGFHAYSGIKGANFSDLTGVRGCLNCRALSELGAGDQRGPQSHTFTSGADAAAKVLEPPLFYAAKWGGFNDLDGDKKPLIREEWDSLDTNGDPSANGDGVPDNYFRVDNPAKLDAMLATILTRIAAKANANPDACLPDSDGDGVADLHDNCTAVSNADQRDTNGDGYGNRCDADLNNNGFVNAADLALFKKSFGTTNSDADFDGNGFVNAADLASFKSLFGKPPGPSRVAQ